ncbi:hypothetical protein [Corynebacterium aquatimens]|uniref:Uncharacterized protein n=1 Tax=Corynebacterium aquatimens TaxID=1190508 RepID=A0A931GST7_9CORY|nr:hypothetical protein [Corynebacterium aquatimens]MBG6122367.1 hypothetical protein [Corynebacterium aquatimens]WJY65090.1 hypothetical protein CAQUA_01785 [Corynebacterium aquatimens]
MENAVETTSSFNDFIGQLATIWNTLFAPFWEVLEPIITLGSGIKTLAGLL